MLGMGQKRKDKHGCPTWSHAKGKVWFTDSQVPSSTVQTQTFNSPRGSSGSEASASCSYDTGVYHCSSSKWQDPPSDTEAVMARCYHNESAVEQSSYEDDARSCPNPHQIAKSCQKGEPRSSGSRPPSQEENYHQHSTRYREISCETVIDVDSMSLPMPSRPRSRRTEPALSIASSTPRSGRQTVSMPSSTPRSGHQSPRNFSLHDPSQLHSLRQVYGSCNKSVEKLPSVGGSVTLRHFRVIPQYNVERQLTPRGMATSRVTGELERQLTPRAMVTAMVRGELDLHSCVAQRQQEMLAACGGRDSKPQRQISSVEGKVIARDAYVDESVLPLPKWPRGQQMRIISSQTMPQVERETMLEPDLSTVAKITSTRSCSTEIKRDPMRVKGGSGPPQTEGVVLSWEGLTVTSKFGKVLLDNLNGQIISGFTAIMGPSGSGKSTLLNTLACRMGQSAGITGRLFLNGRDYKIADLKKMSGYVMQDDLLNAHLTVEETLKYTTRLKLEPSLTEEEVNDRVDEIIVQMGLDHVRNTVIGSPEKRGISGGERKRVCVGMELLTHPQLLFLDEPTSGLDSVTALSLCEQLQKLAAMGNACTIVCTIHQPQAKIFNLFHFLIILKAGQVIYQGKASEVLQFFEDSGFPCPEYTNPADHLLDVITPSINRPRESLRNVDDVLRSKFTPHKVNMSQGSEYLVLQTTRERMPWHRQYIVLLNRGIREQIRKKNVFITQICQSVLMALLIGGVFFQIGDNQKSTVRRQPVLFFCVINQGVFGALTVINSFPGERALTLRERAAGMYYCSSYFMAKVTAEMVSQIVSPIIFSIIVYWMVGFQKNGSKFMIFMCFMVLTQLAATSLALMVSAICRTTDLSVTVLPMALEVNRLFGGFFLSPNCLPKYFAWLDALSYVKYTYTAISLNELHDLTIRCVASEYVNGVCPITTGEQIIASLGLDYLTIGSCITILIFYIIITRGIAYLGIRYLKK